MAQAGNMQNAIAKAIGRSQGAVNKELRTIILKTGLSSPSTVCSTNG